MNRQGHQHIRTSRFWVWRVVRRRADGVQDVNSAKGGNMDTEAGLISVGCACGKRLKAPASAAGKRARCPKCGTVHTLPAPQAAPVAAAATSGGSDPYEVDDPFAAIAEAAMREEQATPLESNAVHCPGCQRAMPDGAVLCVNCGYDSRTGKRAAATKVIAAAPAPSVPSAFGAAPARGGRKGKQIDYMAPTGSLLMGTIFSAVLALAASAIWVGVAYATGYAIGYIAILIGVAAGIGMQAGHKGTSELGGYVAGGMTLGAILTAKMVVLQIVMAKIGFHGSVWDLNSAKVGMYFFSPMGLIIMCVGIAAAYRTASGTSRD